jgi:Ca2+-transporting ATPase
MMRETRQSSQTLFDPRVLFLTISVGIVVSVLLLLLYIILLGRGVEIELARAILFTCFGTYTLFISFSFIDLSRPLFSYSLIRNKLLLAGVGIGLVLMALTVYLPLFQGIFNTAPLPLTWLGFVALWLVGVIVLVECFKWIANTFLVDYSE